MTPAAVRAEVWRVIVHQLDVGDETGACEQALDQVVAKQRVRGEPVLERFAEHVDLVNSLTREDSLAEKVLIDVRHRARVDVEPGLAGVERPEPASSPPTRC